MNRRRTTSARYSALSRATVLATAGLATALALSGCQVMSPIQTSVGYEPADGVAVDLGDVQIRDLVVIAAAKGDVGTLSAMVVNNGTNVATLTFGTGADGGLATTEIPAGQQTRLSGVEGTAPLTLPSIAAAPGSVIKLTIATAAGGAPVVSVPVLLPGGYYAAITPPPAPLGGPGLPTQTATP